MHAQTTGVWRKGAQDLSWNFIFIKDKRLFNAGSTARQREPRSRPSPNNHRGKHVRQGYVLLGTDAISQPW